MENKFLLPSEAGRLAGCSAENMKVLARAGKLKVVKTAGGVHLFSESDVRELAAARREQKNAKRT
jgi:predicted site-specific integrase-resolvase